MNAIFCLEIKTKLYVCFANVVFDCGQSKTTVGKENAVFAEGYDAVGGRIPYSADGSGIQVIDAAIVMLYKGMCMTEKEDIGAHIGGEISNRICSAFNTVSVPVEKDDLLAAEGYRINGGNKGILGMPIAVTANVESGFIIYGQRQKVDKSVAEEDHNFGIRVHRYRFTHIFVSAVRVGEYENFHYFAFRF